MPESHNIWIQFTECDLDNTLNGRVTSFPVLYFTWTPLKQILQIQEHLPAGKMRSTCSNRYRQTEHWIWHPQAGEYVVVISTKYKDLHGWADCVDGSIQVVKQVNMMHILPVWAIVGLAYLVQENAASDWIDSIWLVNDHVELNT